MPENDNYPWVSGRVERTRYAAYLAELKKYSTARDYLKKMAKEKKLEENEKQANQQAGKVGI